MMYIHRTCSMLWFDSFFCKVLLFTVAPYLTRQSQVLQLVWDVLYDTYCTYDLWYVQYIINFNNTITCISHRQALLPNHFHFLSFQVNLVYFTVVQYFDQRNLKSNLLLYSSHQIGERTVQENRHKPHLHIQEAETGEFLLHLLSGNGPSKVASRQVSADEVDAGSVWVGVVRRISTLLPSVSLWYGKPIGLPCRP